MSKKIIAAQLDNEVFDDAQQLIEAGHFAGLDELLDAALRTFVLKYNHTAQSLASRTVQGLAGNLDAVERERFEEFVTAYATIAQQVMSDEDMVSLLEILNAYGFKRAMSALHDAQDSQLPMSPRYLETVLEKSSAPVAAMRSVQSEERSPPRVRVGDDDPVLAEVSQLYEQEIGGLTEKVCDQLKELVVEFPDVQRWHEAFAAAASMNKRNLRYVIGCLKNKGQKVERKGPSKRATSKSEQVREQKRKRNQDYEDYWAQRLEAKRREHTSAK